MKRWWAEKYHSSPKSDEFNSYTLEELLVEFFEDVYLDDKKRMWKDEREAGGRVVLPSVGDGLVDRWEEQWSKGIMPDLTEGLPPKMQVETRARLAEALKKQKEEEEKFQKEKLSSYFSEDQLRQQAERAELPDAYAPKEFSDNYGDM